MTSQATKQQALIAAVTANPFHYGLSLYVSGSPPILGTVDPDEIERLAGEKLDKDNDGAFGYVQGSAGTGLTHKANREAFTRYKIVPRMLVDATIKDLKVTLFGKTYPSPIILGPVGVQGIVHADAELATAKAAGKLGIPFTLSTAATRSIEEVADASGDGPRWYQLYWPLDDDVTLSLLKRAKDNQYTALVVTLDTFQLGWRPKDLARAYLPFIHGVGCSIPFSDPVFMSKIGQQVSHAHPAFPYDAKTLNEIISAGGSAYSDTLKDRKVAAAQWMMEQINSGTYRKWGDLAFLRNNWEGPLILKGIQNVHDAHQAIDAGVDGIIVSNHGGRQVDGAIASLTALEHIMADPRVKEAQASGNLTILFDSGIRTGPDIIKALALGAQAVLIGRSYMYGLAVAGEAGVDCVIRSLLSDLSTTLGLSGYKSLSDVQGQAASGVLFKEVN